MKELLKKKITNRILLVITVILFLLFNYVNDLSFPAYDIGDTIYIINNLTLSFYMDIIACFGVLSFFFFCLSTFLNEDRKILRRFVNVIMVLLMIVALAIEVLFITALGSDYKTCKVSHYATRDDGSEIVSRRRHDFFGNSYTEFYVKIDGCKYELIAKDD